MERSFNLGADAEAYIDEAVRAGRYENAEDMIREGLRLLREHLAAVRRFQAELQKGIDSANRGELTDADVVFDRLERKYRSMAEQRAAAE